MQWWPWKRSGQFSRRDGLFAILGAITCLILQAGCIAYAQSQAPPPYPPPSQLFLFNPFGYNYYQAQWQTVSNPHAQRVTYRTMMLLIGIAAAAAFFRRSSQGRMSGALITMAWVVSAIYVIYVIVRSTSSFLDSYGFGAGLVAILIALGIWRPGRRYPARARTPVSELTETYWRFSWRMVHRFCMAGTILLILVMMLPEFFTRMNLTTLRWSGVVICEVHYGGVLSVGDRMAQGFRLFSDAIPRYGLIQHVILAAWIQHFGDLSMGDYVRIVESLQVIYVLLSVWCYYRVSGRHRTVVFFAALLALCHYGYNSPHWQWYPNHSAWRHMGFPLAMAAMILVQKQSVRGAAVILGFVDGLAILISLELGVAVTAGLVVFIVLQYYGRTTRRSPKLFFTLPILFALGVGAVVAGFIIAYRMVMGFPLDISLFPEMYQHIRTVGATGYGTAQGIPFRPMAILIFAHSTVAFLQAVAHRGPQTGPRNSLRGAVSAMMLTWFVYFANRPTTEYLFCYYVPYGILLADSLRTVIAIRKYRISAMSLSAVAATMFIFGPVLFAESHDMFKDYNKGLPLLIHPPHSTVLSDVFLPDLPRAKDLRLRAAYLKGLDRSKPIIYLTPDCYLMAKLSGIWSQMPLFDAYGEAITPAEYITLIARLVESPAQVIYIDTDVNNLEDTIVGEAHYYQEALKPQLGLYFRYQDTQCGWERWVRK